MNISIIFRIFWSCYLSLTLLFGFLTYKIFISSEMYFIQILGVLPLVLTGILLGYFYIGISLHFNSKKYYPFDKFDFFIKSATIETNDYKEEKEE